jgi:hypothetical protein
VDLPQDGTGVASLERVGAFPASDSRTIGPILLGFVVPLELLAAVLSFLARDKEALAGPWEKQLDRLDREAGVRQQL